MAYPFLKRAFRTGVVSLFAVALVCGGCLGLRSRSVAASILPDPPIAADAVRNGDFSDGLTGWELAGQQGAANARVDGGMLRISANKICPNFQVKQPVALRAGRLYRFSFLYRGADIQSDLTNTVGLRVELNRIANNGRMHRCVLVFPRDDSPMRHVSWYSPPGDETASLTIYFAWASGDVSFDDIKLEEVDTEADTPGVVWPWQRNPALSDMDGRVNRCVPWSYSETNRPATATPPANEFPASPPEAEECHSFIADLDEASETYCPGDGGPAAVTRTALRGETVQFCLGIHAGHDLTDVVAKLLPAASWDLPAPSPGTVRLVRWVSRRGVEERCGTYVRVPEVLDTQPLSAGGEPAGITLKTGQTLYLWVSVDVPFDARRGTHEATLQLTGSSTLHSVPVRVDVSPVALEEPPVNTAILADSPRWVQSWSKNETGTRALIQAELADFQAHGVRSIVLGGFRKQLGDLTLDGDRVTGIEVQPALVFAAQEWARLSHDAWTRLSETRGAAASPRLIIDWSNPLGDILQATGGFTPQQGANYDKVLSETAARGDDLKRDLLAATAGLKQAFSAFPGWAIYGTDEPGGPKYQAAKWLYPVFKQAGVPTFTTSSPLLVKDVLAGAVDAATFETVAFSQARDDDRRVAAIRDAAAAAKVGFWHYANAGMYTLQGANLIRNRYGAGFLMAKVGADGMMIWPYQRPMGDPFNDFDNTGAQWWNTGRDWCLAYPRDDNYSRTYEAQWGTAPPPGVGAVSALQWEAIREAWTDLAYIETARKHLAPNDFRRVQQILDVLPYSKEAWYGPGGLSNRTLDDLRQIIWGALQG